MDFKHEILPFSKDDESLIRTKLSTITNNSLLGVVMLIVICGIDLIIPDYQTIDNTFKENLILSSSALGFLLILIGWFWVKKSRGFKKDLQAKKKRVTSVTIKQKKRSYVNKQFILITNDKEFKRILVSKDIYNHHQIGEELEIEMAIHSKIMLNQEIEIQ